MSLRAPDSEHFADLADRLSMRLCALETDELRTRAAALALAAHPPAEVVLLASALLRRARSSPQAATAVATLGRTLGRGLLDPDFCAACLDAARSRAERAVEAMFAAGPAHRDYDVNDETFVDKQMRALPLGQRRALTRSTDIDTLSRLAHDLDPRVIAQLLMNPRLTEREAILVASRRPTRGEILECVLSSRFGLLQRVRAAIAHNPYAPLTLASRAMTGLPRPQLSRIAGDEKLSEEIRRHARSLIVARGPTHAERHARPRLEAPDEDTLTALDSLLDDLSSGLCDWELELLSE